MTTPSRKTSITVGRVRLYDQKGTGKVFTSSDGSLTVAEQVYGGWRGLSRIPGVKEETAVYQNKEKAVKALEDLFSEVRERLNKVLP